MAVLGETGLEGYAQPLQLESLPNGTVSFMGQKAIDLAKLRYRNGQIEETRLDSTTEVRFSTQESVLAIGDTTKRFSNSVARLLGSLVCMGLEPQPNSELKDDIAVAYRLTVNSAGSLLTEASQALKYWRFDSNGALIVVERGRTGLREDLIFLPQENVANVNGPSSPLKTHRRRITKSKPNDDPEESIKIRENWRDGQYYAVFWRGYVPRPNTTSQDHTAEPTKPSEVKGQLKFTYSQVKQTLPLIRTYEHRITGQLYAAWWPRYEPRRSASLINTKDQPAKLEVEGQQEFTYQDEELNGQRILDIYRGERTDSQLIAYEPDAMPEYSNYAEHPQLDLEDTPKQEDVSGRPRVDNIEETNGSELIGIFRTADVITQTAMTAAFDYFFNGGEMPLATDATTYNAFQRAIQETGGSESTEISGPVIKLYFGKNRIRMIDDIRKRILALGESIHGKKPREMNTRTSTPPNELSDAPKGWMRVGACQGLDPNIFYPDKDADDYSPDVRAAKAVCEHCIVKS